MVRGNLGNRSHVGRMSVQVHRHDRLRPRRDRGAAGRRVHRVICRMDVHEDRLCPGALDGAHGRHGGVGHGDDLVSRPDSAGPQREFDGVGAVGHAHRKTHIVISGKRSLEDFDLWAKNVPAAIQHSRRRRRDLVRELFLQRQQIVEGHHCGSSRRTLVAG